jgi:hypothetical protein
MDDEDSGCFNGGFFVANFLGGSFALFAFASRALAMAPVVEAGFFFFKYGLIIGGIAFVDGR